MKITELRVGDFIGMNLKEFPQNLFTVLEVGETMKVVNFITTPDNTNLKRRESEYFDIADFEPIPLTEEWLVKLGFEETYKSQHTQRFDLISNTKFGYNKNLKTDIYYIRWIGEDFIHIKYVHQLQNLYFALTGEELIIK